MDHILLVGVIQSLFAGSIILFKRDRQKHETILGTWLILIFLQMDLDLLGIYYPEVRILNFDMILLPMLQGPLIFLYTRFLTTENPFLRKRDLFHLLPIAYGTFLFIFFRNFASFTKLPYHEMSVGSRIILVSYGVNGVLINIIYVLMALRLVYRYKQRMEDRFSVSDARNNLQWLRFVQLVSLLVPLLLVLSLLLYVETIKLPVDPWFPLYLCLTLLAFIMGYFGYRQSSVFPVEWVSASEKSESTGNGYLRSGLGNVDEAELMDRIHQHVKDTKAYLDSELTIYKIGNTLDVPYYHVTQAVNRVKGKNFYHYINEMRIEEVKKRMQDDDSGRFTLLALALDCGFNSKTTFNTVFKKFEGLTPTEYKHQQQ